MTKEDQLKNEAYNNVTDAIGLKKVAKVASLPKSGKHALRIGQRVCRELRKEAAKKLCAARQFDSQFTRRVWVSQKGK